MSDESISDNERTLDDWPRTSKLRRAQVAALTKTIRDKVMEIPGLLRPEKSSLDEPDKGKSTKNNGGSQWQPHYEKRSSKGTLRTQS